MLETLWVIKRHTIMKFLLTFVLSLPAFLIIAQPNADAPVKHKGISLHIGHSQLKDENLHPKVFRGLTVESFYFHSNFGNHISEYSAGFRLSAMHTALEEFPSAASISIIGSYRYLFRVVHNEKWNYFLGPVAELQYGTNAYFNWDESHLYFANYLSGGLGNRLRYAMGNKSLDFSLEIPVISGISRPELNRQYKIDDMRFGGILKNLSSNPEVAFMNKNFFVRTGLKINYLSKGGKPRSIGYHFRYHFMQADNGNPYQNIEHFISYKFSFKS